jgi:hypothetical protein
MKARPAEVVMIEPHARGAQEPACLVVLYPDRRVKPRICDRTGTERAVCWCSPCRTLRRRKHRARCTCWYCLCDRMGQMMDKMGTRTFAGRWLWFITMTFRTADHRWQRGFPMLEFRPDQAFVSHFFERAMQRIENQVGGPVEYFLAHQFGSQNGRLHLHCGVSWPDTLFEWRWKSFQEWAWENAGFIRILPWQQPAAFYLSRYIGRATSDCHWDFRVGPEPALRPMPVGRQVVAISPDVDGSSACYRQTLARRHR